MAAPGKLSDTTIRNAKPKDKPFRLFDGGGLYVEITPAGGKLWRMKYRHGGKEKRLALGAYPAVGLKEARARTADARRTLAQGTDPSTNRGKAADADTFAALAERWLAHTAAGKKPATADKHRFLLAQLVPHLGPMAADAITATDVKRAVQSVYGRGELRETASRAYSLCSRIFRYAVSEEKERPTRNPAADVALRDMLPRKATRNHAALTDPLAVGGLLRAIDGYQGVPVTRLALQFAALTFVRPGELRHAEWAEFDGDTWRIPGHKMKVDAPHIVPLAGQALDVLDALRPLTGAGRYLFPSERSRDRPMSENTVNAAIRRMGYSKDEMTGHGFRAMASTLLHEQGFPPMVIERQLAHAERNKVAGAYNRADLLAERRKMMQTWADYLDALRAGGNVVPIRRPKASA